MSKIKVLFLASNPKATKQLALDEEIRQITSKIRAADYRDSIDLTSAWAVRPDDLLQMLNQHKPQIVHFSGHGSESGEIILTSDSGECKTVSDRALEALFTTLKDNIEVVFLNCCYSKEQAKAITQVIDCAIGMSDAIGDKAAITFAASFYRAIGFGRSVKDAFDQGITALILEGIPEENTPKLLVKHGIDPSKVIILRLDNELDEIKGNKRENAGKIIETVIRPLRNCAKNIKSRFENGEYISELDSGSTKLNFEFNGCEFIKVCEESDRFDIENNSLFFIYKKDEILNEKMPQIIALLDSYKDHFIELRTVIESLNTSNIPTFFECDIAALIKDPDRKRDLSVDKRKEEYLFKLYATIITGKKRFNGHTWATDLRNPKSKEDKSKEILDIIKKDSYSNEIFTKVESLKNLIIFDINELISELRNLDGELQNKYFL